MKLQSNRIDAFIRNPDPSIRAVLVYGPDSGLVAERGAALVKLSAGDPDDPFLVAQMSGGDIAADPARLLDEAAAIPLTGGMRVVHVRDANPSAPGAADAVGKAVASYLEDPPENSIVILQASDLGPRSGLRKLFEAAGNGAALPCYADTGAQLDRLIDDVLGARGISLAPDARAFLSANLGSDRGVTRSELEKLAIYAGDSGRLELADVESCMDDNGLHSMDRILMAAGTGNRAELDRAVSAGFQEGHEPVQILRRMNGHLQRLQWIKAGLAAGQAGERALQGLQPPVFWSHRDSMLSQARNWPESALSRGMAGLLEAERLCKSTGTPVEAVCGRALLQIAALAGKK